MSNEKSLRYQTISCTSTFICSCKNKDPLKNLWTDKDVIHCHRNCLLNISKQIAPIMLKLHYDKPGLFKDISVPDII